MKHVTKYKNMFENRGIKIARINSILIHKIYQFTVIHFNFVRCWGPL